MDAEIDSFISHNIGPVMVYSDVELFCCKTDILLLAFGAGDKIDEIF